MHIKVHGNHDTGEAIESMNNILKLFKDRYGISNFCELHLDLTLLNESGEEVELIDADTSEVLGVFEVYKSGQVPTPIKPPIKSNSPNLKLVVDNTK